MRKSVRFVRGMDWEAEQKRSQKGTTSRKQKALQRKLLNTQLKSFLRFAISPDDNALHARNMMSCGDLLEAANSKGFDETTFPGEYNVLLKVMLLLNDFDAIKNNKTIRPLIQSWMHAAIAVEVYSIAVVPDAATHPSRESSTASTLSDLQPP